MPLNNAAMVVAATALQAACAYAQSHFDDPGIAGTANPNTGARQPISWAAPTGSGSFDLASPINFTGIAANNAVRYVSLWSAVSGGTWYGNFLLAGDLVAN